MNSLGNTGSGLVTIIPSLNVEPWSMPPSNVCFFKQYYSSNQSDNLLRSELQNPYSVVVYLIPRRSNTALSQNFFFERLYSTKRICQAESYRVTTVLTGREPKRPRMEFTK